MIDERKSATVITFGNMGLAAAVMCGEALDEKSSVMVMLHRSRYEISRRNYRE
jgi:hypothetical protein